MNLALSKEELQGEICRESFYDFLQTFWEVVIPEKPIWNWHLKYLCDELQRMAERVFKKEPKEYDLIINIPPSSTKSTICSIMFPAWLWTRMPTCRTICGSHTASLAFDLSRRSRLVIVSEKYMKLFPDVRLADDQSAKGYYVNTKNGGRLATMVGGAVTGFHSHFIIVDDPLDPKRAASEADLKSANDWMRETLPTRKVDQSICPTILIMQRLHQNDPTGEWLERTKGIGIKHICLPAEDAMSVSPSILRTEYIDGLLDPVRMSKKILEDARRELGEYGFSAQYDQTPIPRGGGEFKIDRIILEDRCHCDIMRKVRYWDKAGTRGAGCYTAGVLLGVDKNKCFWILDVIRGQWDAFERERIIKLTAEADGRQVEIGIEQEPGSGGLESAQNTVRNLAGFTVFKDRPTGDKATRADPFIVQVNGGNVRMLKGEWNRDYLNELLYWPNSKYKDQVDASSGAFLRLCHVKRRIGAL